MWRCIGDHRAACIHIAHVLYILVCVHTTDIWLVHAHKLLRTPFWRCAARGIQESWIHMSPGKEFHQGEPEIGTFNKPNSEQFSLLFDTLENSLPCERVRLCVKLLDTKLARQHWFYASKLFRRNAFVKGCKRVSQNLYVRISARAYASYTWEIYKRLTRS